jgi:hypothetical protein
MNKFKYKGLLAVLAVAGFVLWAYVARTAAQVTGRNVTVGQNQTIEDDLFLAGANVQVQGEAREDVIAAGREIVISGPVQGYLLAAGGEITVSGPVGNDLFAAGGKLRLNAPVADNAVLAGGEIHLQPNAAVQHDAMLAGGEVEVAGKIERDLKLAAGAARLAAEVGGSVRARVGKLTLAPTAVIRGNLTVYSPTPPEIAPQAQVLGRVEYIQTERESWAASWLKRWLFSFLALSVVGLAAVALAPLWTARVAALFTNKPGETLLTGLAGLILIPVAVVLLLITVIGIPLAFIVLALFVAALLLSGVFAAWFAGGWLLERLKRPQASRWARIIVGALAVSLLVALPLVGVLCGLFVLLAGLGALLRERRAAWRQMPSEMPGVG